MTRSSIFLNITDKEIKIFKREWTQRAKYFSLGIWKATYDGIRTSRNLSKGTLVGRISESSSAGESRVFHYAIGIDNLAQLRVSVDRDLPLN